MYMGLMGFRVQITLHYQLEAKIKHHKINALIGKLLNLSHMHQQLALAIYYTQN